MSGISISLYYCGGCGLAEAHAHIQLSVAHLMVYSHIIYNYMIVLKNFYLCISQQVLRLFNVLPGKVCYSVCCEE